MIGKDRDSEQIHALEQLLRAPEYTGDNGIELRTGPQKMTALKYPTDHVQGHVLVDEARMMDAGKATFVRRGEGTAVAVRRWFRVRVQHAR